MKILYKCNCGKFSFIEKYSQSAHLCIHCTNKYYYGLNIANVADNNVIVEHTVRIYAKNYKISNSIILSSPKNDITDVIFNEGFKLISTDDSYSYSSYLIIFAHPNGNQIIIDGNSYYKQSKLTVIAPSKDPIFKKIELAKKSENKKLVRTKKSNPKITSVSDVIGNEIFVGDWVAFPRSNQLAIGQVSKLRDKTVSIRMEKAKKDIYKPISNISLLNKDQIIVYRLSK